MFEFQKNPFLKDAKVQQRESVTGRRSITEIKTEMSKFNKNSYDIKIPDSLEKRKDGITKIDFVMQQDTLEREKLKRGDEDINSNNYSVKKNNLISNNSHACNVIKDKHGVDPIFSKMNVFKNNNK